MGPGKAVGRSEDGVFYPCDDCSCGAFRLEVKSRGLLYGITLTYFCSSRRKGSPA